MTMIRVCTTKLLNNRDPLAKAGGFLYSLKRGCIGLTFFGNIKFLSTKLVFLYFQAGIFGGVG
jgi:hypothetical protein